jgi:tRNA(Ile)-lysidine synthase
MAERGSPVLKQIPGVNPDDLLVVGVSGGPDSVCLLHLLSTQTSHPLIVAHLDHQLRLESAREAVFVQRLSQTFGWPCIVETADTAGFAQQHSLSIEEAAREVRYQFLFKVAREHLAKAVCVGHNADDQVETVLMHLLRGSGLAGLGGMPLSGLSPWDENILLARPLLETSREEIEAYCLEHQLETVEDLSNRDTTFYRNRLRHELIPFLESYNPQIRTLIGQMADTLRADYAVLYGLVDGLLSDSLLEKSEGMLALDLEKFHNYPLGIQRSLVRKAIGQLRPGLRDIGFQDVERALGYLENPPQTGQADLVANLRLLIEEDRFIIADWDANLQREDWPRWEGEEIPLAIPGITELEGGWKANAELLTRGLADLGAVMRNPDPFSAFFSFKPGETTFTLRPRRPGDRMILLGMEGGSVKIAELMINAKVPRRARERWPLVLSADRVVWVPGVRQSAEFSVGEGTETILKLNLERNG